VSTPLPVSNVVAAVSLVLGVQRLALTDGIAKHLGAALFRRAEPHGSRCSSAAKPARFVARAGDLR